MKHHDDSGHAVRRYFANSALAGVIALAVLLITVPSPVTAQTLHGGIEHNTLNGNVQQNSCDADSPGPGWVREELDVEHCGLPSGPGAAPLGPCVWRKCPPPV